MDEDMVLWGTIRGWSKKLGLAEEVLRERFNNLRSQPTNDPATRAYAEPDVLEACADLLRPQMVDTSALEGKEIRKQLQEEREGP
jgi:hypothetical protein